MSTIPPTGEPQAKRSVAVSIPTLLPTYGSPTSLCEGGCRQMETAQGAVRHGEKEESLGAIARQMMEFHDDPVVLDSLSRVGD